MIPKIIHYCWFGGSSLPELAVKCIESWKKHFPDYEIKEWNETNFDLECCDYVREAYKKEKWAFVSDYARFWTVYNFGGIYFDTDVEVINDMESILKKGPFFGTEPTGDVAPGLGMAGIAGSSLYKEILDFYRTIHFIEQDGSMNDQTVVKYTTDLLVKKGFRRSGEIENVEGITIYPPEFFCPQNYETGECIITDQTYSIHHYAATWHSRLDNIVILIERCHKGKGSLEFKLRRIVSFPFRCVNKLEKIGWKNTLKFVIRKLKH